MEKRFTEPNTSMKAMDERYQKLEYFDTDTGRFWVSPTDSRAASNLAKELEKERRTSTILGNFCHSFPMCIKRRGTATIVEWCDGTVTKIVRQKDAPGAHIQKSMGNLH